MNKIERAIYDCKLYIEELEREKLIVSAELNTYRKQLGLLEAIKNDKSIPDCTMPKDPWLSSKID